MFEAKKEKTLGVDAIRSYPTKRGDFVEIIPDELLGTGFTARVRMAGQFHLMLLSIHETTAEDVLRELVNPIKGYRFIPCDPDGVIDIQEKNEKIPNEVLKSSQ